MTDYDNSYLENKALKEEVKKDTPIKEWLVNYVGTEFLAEVERINAEKPEKPLDWDGSITVEMIIERMAKEFPEFLMSVAEENFIRGYTQAMVDVYETEQAVEE